MRNPSFYAGSEKFPFANFLSLKNFDNSAVSARRGIGRHSKNPFLGRRESFWKMPELMMPHRQNRTPAHAVRQIATKVIIRARPPPWHERSDRMVDDRGDAVPLPRAKSIHHCEDRCFGCHFPKNDFTHSGAMAQQAHHSRFIAISLGLGRVMLAAPPHAALRATRAASSPRTLRGCSNAG